MTSGREHICSSCPLSEILVSRVNNSCSDLSVASGRMHVCRLSHITSLLNLIHKFIISDLIELFLQVLRSYMCRNKNNKYPTCYVHLTTPSNDVDVNLEPNKTKVLLASKVSSQKHVKH